MGDRPKGTTTCLPRHETQLLAVASLWAASLALPLIGSAQQAQPHASFEVASVRRNVNGASNGSLRLLPGSVLAMNASLQLIMMQAYGIAGSLGRFKFVEGPRELLEARFDISAK